MFLTLSQAYNLFGRYSFGEKVLLEIDIDFISITISVEKIFLIMNFVKYNLKNKISD